MKHFDVEPAGKDGLFRFVRVASRTSTEAKNQVLKHKKKLYMSQEERKERVPKILSVKFSKVFSKLEGTKMYTVKVRMVRK